MTRYSHSGSAVATTLTADITSGDTSAVVAAVTGWPDGSIGPFWVKIDGGLASEETVLVTSRVSTTISGLTRGADGTSPQAHSAGASVEHVFSATEADNANELVEQALVGITGKGDTLAGTSAENLGVVTAGTDGYVLQADSAQTAGVKWAARTDQTDGYVSLPNRHDNTGLVARATTTYTDLGASTSITVPTWATAAIIHTHVRNLYITVATGASFSFRTVLAGVNGDDHLLGPWTATAQEPYQMDYIDVVTGLTPGSTTVKTQAKGDGTAGGNLSYTPGPATVDILVEFRP